MNCPSTVCHDEAPPLRQRLCFTLNHGAAAQVILCLHTPHCATPQCATQQRQPRTGKPSNSELPKLLTEGFGAGDLLPSGDLVSHSLMRLETPTFRPAVSCKKPVTPNTKGKKVPLPRKSYMLQGILKSAIFDLDYKPD